jgi:hypothetical protein
LKEIAEAAAGDREESADKAALFRYMVLAHCLGKPAASQASSDPALRLLAGCSRASLNEDRGFSVGDLHQARAVFARHLLERTGCAARCLLAEVVRIPGCEEEVLLLRDIERNIWIHACVWPQEQAERERCLSSAIEFLARVTGNTPRLLLRGPLAELADSQALQHRGFNLCGMWGEVNPDDVTAFLSQAGCDSDSMPRREIVRLLAPPDAEFAYFSFMSPGRSFGLAPDLLTTLICRAAMRDFARRLQGFHSASPEHLYRNFLEGIGTIRILAQRIEVQLPRCPLSMVLQLSGLERKTYTVPWLEGREVCLLPPRE